MDSPDYPEEVRSEFLLLRQPYKEFADEHLELVYFSRYCCYDKCVFILNMYILCMYKLCMYTCHIMYVYYCVYYITLV